MRLPTQEKVRYHLVRWVWVPALALVAHVAFPSGGADVAPLLEPGARSNKDVVAPFNFVVNKSEDELQREAEELAASAKPIYEFRERAYDSSASTMAAFFSAIDAVSDQGPQAIIHAAAEYGIPLSLQEAAYLSKGGKRRALQQALQKLFDRTLAQGVTGPGVLQGEQSRELIVRRGSTESSVQRDKVLAFTQYLNRAKQLHPDPGSSVGDVLYIKLQRQFFRPTLIPKPLETERRRNELRGSVDPSKYIVRAGDRIVGANEIVTNEAHERLVTLHQELLRRGAATTQSIRGVIGPLLRDSLIIAIFWVLLVFYRRETYRDLRQVALIGGLFAMLLTQAGLLARFYPAQPEIVFMPFVAMMMTVLFNGRVSMIAAMILSVVIGLQPVFHDVPATFLCIVGGVTAALSVKTLRSRSNFYAPVLIIAAGYLTGALALGLSSGWPIEEIGLRGLWGTLNGLVSAGLTFFLLPVAESITHITTDLTLLEPPPAAPPLSRGAGDVRAQRGDGESRRGSLQPHRRERPPGTRRVLLPRYREGQESAVLRGEPDPGQQSARPAEAAAIRADHQGPRHRRARARRRGRSSRFAGGVHSRAPRHDGDHLLPRQGEEVRRRSGAQSGGLHLSGSQAAVDGDGDFNDRRFG